MLKYVNHDIVFQEFPDEVTLAINLSLCPHGCPGCHSSYLQKDVGEVLTAERLIALIGEYDGLITCVGLMGGDNDVEAVAHMATVIHSQAGLRVGWYSGRTDMPSHIPPSTFDYVKLGPYREQRGPLNASTTNQRLYRVNRSDGMMIDITARFQKGG